MIQDAIEHQEKDLQLSCVFFRDTNCIKVEIGLEVDVLIIVLFTEVFRSCARKSS
jgi:hypothetical protein